MPLRRLLDVVWFGVEDAAVAGQGCGFVGRRRAIQDAQTINRACAELVERAGVKTEIGGDAGQIAGLKQLDHDLAWFILVEVLRLCRAVVEAQRQHHHQRQHPHHPET